MSDTNFDQHQTGFAFTDEDYARRYFPGKSSAAPLPTSPVVVPPSAKRPARLHGGGNSFMRARRRRLAVSQRI